MIPTVPVSVRLLGAPAYRHEGEWSEPAPGRASALFFYLAYRGSWVVRDELSYLFWPDLPQQNARSNLRKLLSRALKGSAYTAEAEVEPVVVRVAPSLHGQLLEVAVGTVKCRLFRARAKLRDAIEALGGMGDEA